MKRRNILRLIGSTPILPTILATADPLTQLKRKYNVDENDDKTIISRTTTFSEEAAIYDISYHIHQNGKLVLNLYYKKDLTEKAYRYNTTIQSHKKALQVFEYHEQAEPDEMVEYFESIYDTKQPYVIYIR